MSQVACVLGDHQFFLSRNVSFHHALEVIQGHFDARVRFTYRNPATGTQTEITSETWPHLATTLDCIHLIVEPSEEDTSNMSTTSASPLDLPSSPSEPPPYTRRPTNSLQDREQTRKISFIITTPHGEAVTLTAKRSVKTLKALEAACHIFKLDPELCRLKFDGRLYGHADLARLTLASIHVDDQDELRLEWEERRSSHRIWLSGEDRTIRVVTELAPHWTFTSMTPWAPVDLARTKTTTGTRQRVKRDLYIKEDGMAEDFTSGKTVSSISWETTFKPVANIPPSPSPSSTFPSASPSSPSRDLVDTSAVSISAAEFAPSPATLPAPSDTLVHIFTAIALDLLISILVRLGLLAERHLGRLDSLSWERPTGKLPTQQSSLLPLESTQHESFNPSCPEMTPENSVLLDSTETCQYIYNALDSMGFSDAAKQLFIIEHRPSLLRHKHIALRFLSKRTYETSCTLSISPAPDRIVRAFLLYEGVSPQDILKWNSARLRRLAGPGIWKQVVGEQNENGDSRLVVMEVGGMEVLL